MNELLDRQFDFRPRVAVFGDAILDEYYDVSANRVSPEFPIPVLKAAKDEPSLVLGGAANVCRQFSNFNFEVSLFSFVNDKIRSLAGDVDVGGCIHSHGVPVKKRFYSDGFPLCRLDFEGENYSLDSESLGKMQESLLKNLLSSKPFDVVVFSDYDKGVFRGFGEFIKEIDESTITIVDPKKLPVDRWRGCTIIKPNSKEAEEISGRSDWKRQCEYFMGRTECQAVVITQAGEGVVGNVQGGWFEYRPSKKKSPRSVVGAGDAFVAFLAMCMAHSIDIRRAVEIAFEACSFYVDQPQNAPIHPVQIAPSKFVDPRVLAKRDFSLSFANGCFDIIHPGHVSMLEFAKSKSERLVVAINSDRSVANQNKTHGMVNDLLFRKSMVAALGCVDFVVDFDEDTPYELVKNISPDVLVSGWPKPVGAEFAGEVCPFDLVGGHSTTSIIEKIRRGS